MKKIFSILVGLMLLAHCAGAYYVTSNTGSTSWNSVTVEAGSSSASDYVATSGCRYALLTNGDSTTGAITAEAWWYLAPGSSVLVSAETMTVGTALGVKSPRAKFSIFNAAGSLITVEAVVYCY